MNHLSLSLSPKLHFQYSYKERPPNVWTIHFQGYCASKRFSIQIFPFFFFFFHKMEILKVNYLGSVVALIERLIFQILQITFIIKGNASFINQNHLNGSSSKIHFLYGCVIHITQIRHSSYEQLGVTQYMSSSKLELILIFYSCLLPPLRA